MLCKCRSAMCECLGDVSTCRRIEALMHESQATFTSEAHYRTIAAEQSLVSLALQQIREKLHISEA